ncbi:MAG: hypothetical protein KF691_12820 [Phycisphaeraceae bacterium]|nr:hypothetical protein [Phycisphaeraceae bacterium]
MKNLCVVAPAVALLFAPPAWADGNSAPRNSASGLASAPEKPAADKPSGDSPSDQKKEDEIPTGAFDLRPKFQFGQNRRIRLSLDSRETKPDPAALIDNKAPQEDEMKTQQDFVLVFKPTKPREDGNSQVDIVIESIRSHVEGPGVNDSFDSKAPAKKPALKKKSDPLNGLGEPPTLEETLRPLVGETLTVLFDPDGNVLQVRGGEKFVRALNPMAPEEMMQIGGDQKLRELFKSIVSTPGKRYAKRGERWSSDTSLDLFPIGGSRLHTDYQLTKVQGSRGRIEFDGQLVPASDPSPGSGGLKLSKAEYSGFTDWDQEDGFLRSSQANQKLDAELKIGEQTISLRQSQKMIVERLK